MPTGFPRAARLVLTTAVIAALLVAGPAATHPRAASAVPSHPSLLLTAADLPAIRARATTGEGARAWATLQERLADYTTSPAASPYHLDPAKVGKVGPNGKDRYYDDQNELPSMMVDLSFAYLVTGQVSYGRLADDVLLALAAQQWPFWQQQGQYLGAGDLLRGVGLTFDWTYDLLTPAERLTIVQALGAKPSSVGATNRILDIVSFGLPASDPGSNWGGVTAGGAGLALLAIQGEPGEPADSASLLTQATNRIGAYLGDSFGPNGDGGEGWTYSGYGLHDALPFALSLRSRGGSDLIAANPGIAHIVDWGAAQLIPAAGFDGVVPLNDSFRDSLDDEYVEYTWALAPTSGLVSWFWDHTLGPLGADRYKPGRTPPELPGHNCMEPQVNPVHYTLFCGISNAEETNLIYNRHSSVAETSPAAALPLAEHFDAHGLATARTGWDAGANDVLSTFQAHRGSGGHTQEDIGQFTLYGYGSDFAVASGYGHTYGCTTALTVATGCDPNDSLNRAGQSQGHNLVLVDDNTRTQRGALTNTTAQTVPDYAAGTFLTYARADTRYQFGSGGAPAASRGWLLAHAPGRPIVLAIADEMNRDGAPHAYDWQMHTSVRNVVAVHGPGFTMTSPTGATLSALTARDGDLAASTAAVFEPQPFVADATTVNRPGVHQLLLQVDAMKKPVYDGLALMALTAPGQAPAVVDRLDAVGGNAIESLFNGTHDLVLQRLAGATTITATGISCDGAVASVTEGMGETLLRSGTTLTAYGRSYVTVTGGPASVLVSGQAVSVTGPTGASYRVYAPQAISTVTVNGAVVTPTRSSTDPSYLTFS